MADQKISRKRLEKKIQKFTGNSELRITAEKQELELSTGQYAYRYYFLTSEAGNFKTQEAQEEPFNQAQILCFKKLSELQNWFINLSPNSEVFQRLCFFGKPEKKEPLDADFALVRIRTTCGFDLSDSFELKKFVDSVDTIYLVNRKSHTHLCEMTPSYALYPLYCEVNYSALHEAELTEEKREELQDFSYECLSAEPNVEYMHVSEVDRIIASGRFLQIEADEFEGCESEEEAIESLSEYYRGNICL